MDGWFADGLVKVREARGKGVKVNEYTRETIGLKQLGKVVKS